MTSAKKQSEQLVVVDEIDDKIYLIRGQRVMLDSDLAAIYKVETKALNQAVKRNVHRFPKDFMFQLTDDDADSLRSQFVTSNTGRGDRRRIGFVETRRKKK